MNGFLIVGGSALPLFVVDVGCALAHIGQDQGMPAPVLRVSPVVQRDLRRHAAGLSTRLAQRDNRRLRQRDGRVSRRRRSNETRRKHLMGTLIIMSRQQDLLHIIDAL